MITNFWVVITLGLTIAVRHEFLEYLGLDADDVARKGNALALSQLDMKFRAPLRSKDIVRGTVVTSKVTGARIIMDQELYRLARQGEPDGQVTLIRVPAVLYLLADFVQMACTSQTMYCGGIPNHPHQTMNAMLFSY